jgi:hypothetical protein
MAGGIACACMSAPTAEAAAEADEIATRRENDEFWEPEEPDVDELEGIDLERRERRLKQGGRVNSISEEIRALKEGRIDAPSTNVAHGGGDAQDDRVACPCCARKFAPDRLARHQQICDKMKTNQQWRGEFKADKTQKREFLESSPAVLRMPARGGASTPTPSERTRGRSHTAAPQTPPRGSGPRARGISMDPNASPLKRTEQHRPASAAKRGGWK